MALPSPVCDDKHQLSLEELEAGILPPAQTRSFVICMLRIYSDAAALQYEEAERLMAIALSAKASADAIMCRCADLVAENLGPDGEWAEAEPNGTEVADGDDIPW